MSENKHEVFVNHTDDMWAVYRDGKLVDSGAGADAVENFVSCLNLEISCSEVDEEWYEKKEGVWPKKSEAVKTV